MRPDSSTSSIRRLCRNTPLPPSALVAPGEETPLSFDAGSAPGGENTCKNPFAHARTSTKIAPSEPEVRITVAPIVVVAVDHDSEPWTHSEESCLHSCMPRGLRGKISDSKGCWGWAPPPLPPLRAAGPSEGLRARRSSGGTKAGVDRGVRTTRPRDLWKREACVSPTTSAPDCLLD